MTGAEHYAKAEAYLSKIAGHISDGRLDDAEMLLPLAHLHAALAQAAAAGGYGE